MCFASFKAATTFHADYGLLQRIGSAALAKFVPNIGGAAALNASDGSFRKLFGAGSAEHICDVSFVEVDDEIASALKPRGQR